MPRKHDDDDDDDDRLPSIRKDNLDRNTLWSVAVYQKGILVCILIYFLVVVMQFFLPSEIRWMLALIALPTVIAATVFVFLLSTNVYNVGLGVLLGILTLIPCVGLVVLLIINGKATSILRANGIRVGLMGANLSDLR
jgi:hypothetical protein